MSKDELILKHYDGTPGSLPALMEAYGKLVIAEAVAVVNRARQEGESDLRGVRASIQYMDLP